ncbi:MAG TPA: ATP-binding cassette domain-containing protein [Candidatus Limnocylindrales bacterium]|nr:ATP-binding cassette domain-containing protein [Candidatus Limnocylindrales bacterium]
MSIVLANVTKRYGSQTVVKNVSLEIGEGGLFVLLGASGSGKSTVLRMIAGLTTCDEGRILIKGRDVTHLAPQPRGTGLVFQNYSIFRHMTVAENIEFGLKIRKVASVQRAKRRDELLELVGLTGYGDRYPHQISGGQQQRVALARALAYEPSVLLLDEPLGALDVKIRAQLRRSLKEIQRRLRVTTLLVTHDQEEAYELADRIGVMDRGTLLEVGVPEELYHRPRTLYVASFLGGGTVLAGRVANGLAHFGPLSLPIPAEVPHEEGASAELLFRPEHVILSSDPPASNGPVLGKGRVVEQTFSGAARRLRLHLPHLPSTRQVSPAVAFGEQGIVIETSIPASAPAPADEPWVSLRNWAILGQAPPRLLVIDTGSGPLTSLHTASALAGPMRASVIVLGYARGDAPEDFRDTVAHRAQSAELNEAEVHIGTSDLPIQIATESANTLFDFIILSGNPGAAKAGLKPDVVSFLEGADTPVIVVAAEAPKRFERILICTRAGEPGKNDIRIGGRLARHLGAQVTLLHIQQPELGEQPLARRHLEMASATLSGLEVQNTIRTYPDPSPAEAILREAAKHDLIVVGGHGPEVQSLFSRDDITLQVLMRVPCPVLVVPAE